MEKKSPLAAVSIGVEYTQNAVIRSLQHKGWIVNGSSSSTDSSAATSGATSVALHWSDFSAIPWDAVLDGSTTASAQYLKTGLVRKADLLHYMTKHGVAHWLPTTISADIEDEEDIDELIAKWSKACDIDASKREAGADAERPLWLLKPSRANRGEGIAVLRSGDESAARSAIARFPRFRDWLLQRYVVPLLLPPSPSVLPMATLRPELRSAACGGDGSGLKCHLRLHVLAVGSLSVWVHDAPLVLLASQPWSNPAHSVISPDGDGDEVDLLAHLTNRCRQARGESYDERAHTRRFREAFGPPLADRLLEQCKSIAAAAFKPFERGSAAFLPLPHCFELYGFDIAIDAEGSCLLLEVNSGPDLSLHGSRLEADADALLRDVLSVVANQLYQSEPVRGAAAALKVREDGDAVSPSCAGGFTRVLSQPCADPRAQLDRFKRSLATVGKFAHSMHESAGAPVRGMQGVAMRAAAGSQQHGATAM